MTIIVVRDGIMASDSRVTVESDAGGIRVFQCQKLYKIPELKCVIGVTGDGFAALRFVQWYRTLSAKKKRKPMDTLALAEADFTAVVMHADGRLEEYDRWCTPEEIELGEGKNAFYAVGCGTKLALGALAMGASASQAVEIACKYDPFCALPVVLVDKSEL
jgi:hypothetical protein